MTDFQTNDSELYHTKYNTEHVNSFHTLYMQLITSISSQRTPRTARQTYTAWHKMDTNHTKSTNI